MPRVVFTFDDRTLENLQTLTRDQKLRSMAETVRRSIRSIHTIRNLLKQNPGYDQIVLRDSTKKHPDQVLSSEFFDALMNTFQKKS